MTTLYILTMVTASFLSAVGFWPAALILAAVGLVIVIQHELRAGLRKFRRPAVKHVVPERI